MLSSGARQRNAPPRAARLQPPRKNESAPSACRHKIAQPRAGALDAEQCDKGGLAGGGILAGFLAERCRIAFDIEQIVGDLEGFAERAAVIVERLVLRFPRRAAENRAGNTGENATARRFSSR